MATYTPVDVIQLPRLPTASANALGRQMVAAADAQKPFPKGLVKPRDRLRAAHTALQEAILAQFGAGAEGGAPDERAAQECDRILDNCWAGLDDRLAGLARLPPGAAGVAEAAALRKRLFPTGLSFLKLPYKVEWSESQTRIDLVDRDGLAPVIAKLAGEQFLPAIRDAHTAYGKALGMDKPLAEAAAVPLVRGALDAFAAALRAYVLKVLASVDEDDPATQAVADALLAPLAAWSTPVKRSKEEATAPPAEPAAEAEKAATP